MICKSVSYLIFVVTNEVINPHTSEVGIKTLKITVRIFNWEG